MSENTIFVRKYSGSEGNLSQVNEKELWRYSGYLGINETKDESLIKLLKEAMDEAWKGFDYKICFRRLPLAWENDKALFPWMYESLDLNKCVKGCDEIIIFAATVGLGIDRSIAKSQHLSCTKALLLQALGAERIESLCNHFCDELDEELRQEGKTTTPRYSPGYGDLPLEVQRDFFKLLDCNRQIGISLGESLLMTPSKSVTAVIGIKNGIEKCHEKNRHDCSACSKLDCEFRTIKE